ncbi:carbohydrate esterase family 16 protein, partial [Serendipita vermifera MAFF 305830]
IFRGGKWKGIRNIQNMFIFGDSYSSVNDDDSFMPHPTREQPLGTPFPGDPWTERGPNWVGHLVRVHQPQLKVYDYAKGGATISGLSTQIRKKFLARHATSVQWSASDSLFVLWIGINDLAETSNPVQSIQLLFQLMGELHNAGARNFLLLDCPPIHRTPNSGDPESGPNSDRFEDWNGLFPVTTPNGVGVGGDTSVFVFSSWSTFMSILDYPEAYGFDEDEVDEAQGPVWMDDLHPTSKVHGILAKHLNKFLTDI